VVCTIRARLDPDAAPATAPRRGRSASAGGGMQAAPPI
jgi:hypothetical protein